tara:strand:+ start:199 stop:1719 length:1521 start_codon:yes stop_codon:yes gene_type:complete
MEHGKKMDMQAQTAPDAPKKNAAPAEAPKSLGATIQNVISKAVTSPTDGKIDFAQGVNHITGDPHQKSAGPADAMQSLKAQNDMKQKDETYHEDEKKDVKEAEEKEKEDIKSMADKEKMMKAQADIKKMNAEKEKEMKEEDEAKKEIKAMAMKKVNAEKDKEDMKEGEMPKAALDALKKSQDKKEEKEDDKKEIKAQKDKEMKEEDDKKDLKAEKEKEMLKAEIEKMKKELNDKEKMMASYDKEMKEEDEKKKEIKASAKEKVKDMDMKEDVSALTDGEELSEEFKQKAATIFESAVKAKLVEEIEKLESEYESKVAEKVEDEKAEIVEKVDAYLNYVVEEWMKDNELAIEKGLKSEITEDFIGGLKKLFETHYIDMPDSKFDVVEDQAKQIVKLKEELNSKIENNVELNQKIGEFARDEIINDVSSDLAETEKEKLKGLAESIEYVDAADYRGKVETIKNSYFPAQKASDTESNEVADTNQTPELNESMAAYTAAISKTKNKKLY